MHLSWGLYDQKSWKSGHDRSWLIMIDHDRSSIMIDHRSWSTMIDHDRSWSIMIDHDRSWSIMIDDLSWSMIYHDRSWSITIDHDLIFTIFDRTDLRKGASKAKFYAESDFDVRLAVDRPKPDQICKKRIFRSKIFAEKKCLVSKNETSAIVRNAFWQSFAPIGAKFEG